MQTSWIVQTNVERESASPALLRAACATLELPFHGVSVVRGSKVLPELPRIAGPVVFHGRGTLIRCALEHPLWRRGVFFSDTSFKHTAYVDGYGKDMLNADAQVLSIAELLTCGDHPDTKIFVRPDDDSKRFPGQVTTLAALRSLGWTRRPGEGNRCRVAPLFRGEKSRVWIHVSPECRPHRSH